VRPVIWTAEAVANFRSIHGYVSAFNKTAAARLAGRLQMAANSLS
jgi:plasmid stabilization system protein ParE